MDYPSQPQSPMPANTSNKKKWIAIGVVILVLILAIVWYFMGGKNGKVLGVSTSANYQAVFLTNGQVYFGKLKQDGDWVNLTDIYYLQVTQNLQDAAGADQAKNASPSTTGTANQNPNIQLVKLGSELHGPTDSMHIEKDKVLFWEDMKSDSKVMQAIQSYKSK